jgi:hypothetical protein
LGAFSDLLERPTDRQQTDDKFLRLDTPDWNPKNPQSAQATVRILDEQPVKVFRHWFQNAEGRNVPLNCPGRKECPACFARSRAYREGDPSWKELYRSDTKYLFNVAVELEGKLQVRIWSVGQRLLKDIDFYTARKGYENVRNYDFELTKARIGPAQMNIEYKVFPSPPNGFGEEYEGLLDQRFDLAEETIPATTEEIKRAIAEQAGLQLVGPNGTGRVGAATVEQLAELNSLAQSKEYTLEALGVDVSTLTQDQADKYISDLKS